MTWQLYMTNDAREWASVGNFDTMTGAARRIIEIEDYPVSGIHLEMHVDTNHGADAEAFAHLEHTGRKNAYVIKRVTH